MEKATIKNRKGQQIAVITDVIPSAKGLAFVMHGLGGFKEQPHIQTIAAAFKESGYSVVRFDTTNTLGESDGNYEDATTTNYYEDLEDVITWAARQRWYQEPFVLAGHSLGSICVALFAENYLEKVKALAPVSMVVSGKLTVEAMKHHKPDELKKWQTTGWLEEVSNSKPGVVKRLKWSHMEDRLKYNLMPKVDSLTMPVLLIVGEEDVSTPPEHQKILFEALPGEKEFHIINGAPHTWREEKHLVELKQIITNWIRKCG